MKWGDDRDTLVTALRDHNRRSRRHVFIFLIALALCIPVAAYAAGRAEASEPVARAAIAEAFPTWAAPSFVRIARCESEFVPTARSWGWDRFWGRYDYRGLLQVSIDHHQWRADRLFWPGASLYDPRVNAHVAAEVFREQGWQAWPYCRRFA